MTLSRKAFWAVLALKLWSEVLRPWLVEFALALILLHPVPAMRKWRSGSDGALPKARCKPGDRAAAASVLKVTCAPHADLVDRDHGSC